VAGVQLGSKVRNLREHSSQHGVGMRLLGYTDWQIAPRELLVRLRPDAHRQWGSRKEFAGNVDAIFAE
jgi:hypothetical protein